MLAKITSLPALGQWTVLLASQPTVHFTVLFETNVQYVEEWQVEIWWGSVGSAWSALGLRKEARLGAGVLSTPFAQYHHWFSGALPRPQSNIQFTVRFRTSSDADWKWAGDASAVEDGRLLVQTDRAYSDELSHYVDDFDSDHLSAQKSSSDAPDTAVWLISGIVPPADHDMPGRASCRIGKIKRGQKWFALVRLTTPWLAPRHGKFVHELAPEDAILYAFLRDDGLHVVFLAVSGIDDVQTLFHGANGALVLSSRNEAERERPLHVVASVGRNIDAVIAAAMYKARSLVTPYNQEIPQTMDVSTSEGGVEADWVQNWVDGFAYCTWNGLGKNLSEEKLLQALDSIHENGFSVTNLIIDDGWQSVDHDGDSNMVQGWRDFEANKTGFPDGLGQAIRNVRAKYPRLQHVAVWHAMLGYWGGVSPDGNLASRYRTRKVPVRRDATIIADGSILVIDPEDARQLYDDFYRFLATCTVDAVKTDAQFVLDELTSARDRRDMFGTYKSAWTISHLTHFTGRAISCMSQTPYMLFAAQLPSNSMTLPVRNSDDFFPHVEDSHPWHIYCNAYNSLMTKHLNVVPDWDMFQTDHPWASFHAAARCLSGGPIYITDEPRKHNVDLIKQMTAQTIRDQTVILRPSVVGRAADVYCAYNDECLLKIDAYNGQAMTGCSFAGFFNCHKRSLSRLSLLKEFIGVDERINYVLRAYRSGITSDALSPDDPAAVFGVDVDACSWEIVTAHPVLQIKLPITSHENLPIQVSVLGLLSHMSGGAAVTSATARVTPTGSLSQLQNARHRVHIQTSVKALGTLGIWVSIGPTGDAFDLDKNRLLVLIEDRVVPAGSVTITRRSNPPSSLRPSLLEVDLSSAWKALSLRSTYSNEVHVDVFL